MNSQYYLPHEVAFELMSIDQKKCKKSIAERQKLDKKGVYITVPDFHPPTKVFVLKSDLKNQAKLEKIFTRIRNFQLEKKLNR